MCGYPVSQISLQSHILGMFYDVTEPKVSGESNSERDQNASYNRSPHITENSKKHKVVCR